MLSPWHWKYSANDPMVFDPALRKATTLMKLLHHGLDPLLGGGKQKIPRKPVQVFLGSLHGEIEPTFDFLKSYAQREWARPFLFQNSLHHSTTGFVSQKFELLGPCYSICAISNPQAEILRAGLLQIFVDPRATLFLNAECFPADLSEISRYEENKECEILYIDEATAMNIQQDRKLLETLLQKESFLRVFSELSQSGQVSIETPS